MKAFLVALVLVVACQAKLSGLCADDLASGAPIGEVVAKARDVLGEVFAPCKVGGANIVKFFLKPSTGCKSLIEQGYCYYTIVSKRTDPIVGLTYAQVKKGLPDIAQLAKIGCSNSCYANMLPHVKACYNDPEVKAAIMENLSKKFEIIKAMAAKYESGIAGTPIGKILTMGLKKYASLADISAFVEKHRALILKNILEIKQSLADFCDAKCYNPTKSHLLKLVKSINKGQCDNPKVFCGPCAKNAVKALKKSANKMPCCMKKLYDFLMMKADAAVDRAAVSESKLFGAITTLSTQNEQFVCVRSVYDDHSKKVQCA